ncbi:TPA: hypothetical protein HA246_03545 [Candidatus Woesearchaeota archaeon]|nr:hypothetical protein [Candidatus Woesearchaeota archaeon]
MRIPEINKIFNVKRSKKASLSLSINAIVVLVLAISMLGLGLAFTKSMFKKFGEKLTVPPPDIPATQEDPISLPSDEMEVKHGEEFAFQVNFYNDHSSNYVDAGMRCSEGSELAKYIYSKNSPPDLSSGSAVDGIYVLTSKQKVQGGTQKSFKFIIPKKATPTTLTGEIGVCEVRFCAPDKDTGDGAEFTGTGGICDSDSAEATTVHEYTKQVTIKIT